MEIILCMENLLSVRGEKANDLEDDQGLHGVEDRRGRVEGSAGGGDESIEAGVKDGEG